MSQDKPVLSRNEIRRVLDPFAKYGAACKDCSPEDAIAIIKQRINGGPLEVVAAITVGDCLIARDILALLYAEKK